jgi:hypothetical protein
MNVIKYPRLEPEAEELCRHPSRAKPLECWWEGRQDEIINPPVARLRKGGGGVLAH